MTAIVVQGECRAEPARAMLSRSQQSHLQFQIASAKIIKILICFTKWQNYFSTFFEMLKFKFPSTPTKLPVLSDKMSHPLRADGLSAHFDYKDKVKEGIWVAR